MTALSDAAGDLFRSADPTFRKWTADQSKAFELWAEQVLDRGLLFYPTGKGKTKTALTIMYQLGVTHVVVIAPPRTHADWKRDAAVLGIQIETDSVQGFRLPDHKYSKNAAWIIDEFHLFGKHGAAGFTKLNRMLAHHIQPVILASATPNYNDAERVFCVTAICDKVPVRNYGDWITKNCKTTPNRYAFYDDVVGFYDYDGAEDYLAKQPWCSYIRDDASWQEQELILNAPDLTEFETIGLSRRHHKIVASVMEKRHKRTFLQLIGDDGTIRSSHMQKIFALMKSYEGKWLIFCGHAQVADALYKTMAEDWDLWSDQNPSPLKITGEDTDRTVQVKRAAFTMLSNVQVLIGTATIATGLDGIDKVCKNMLILDPVLGDDSLERQLIGRILPRGVDDGVERLVVKAIIP